MYPSQAGAKHVYAVEASEMADYARQLFSGNKSLSERITVRTYLGINLSMRIGIACFFQLIQDVIF